MANKMSNPYSTGGGGVNFETDVQTSFLIMLLSKFSLPYIGDNPVVKIALQGKIHGFSTDDIIVYSGQDASCPESLICIQIKHSIAFSEENTVFNEVISAAFSDYNKPQLFNSAVDRIAIATSSLTKTDSSDTRTILDWAKNCVSHDEYLKKINEPQFGSKRKQDKYKVFKTVLSKAKGAVVTDKEVWEFLRIFYIITFDFENEFSDTLLSYQLVLQSITGSSGKGMWNELTSYIRNANKNAGTITIDTIPNNITVHFAKVINCESEKDWKKIKEYSDDIINGIKTTISGYEINRNFYIDSIVEAYNEHKIIEVIGKRGCGKSAIVKKYIEMYGRDKYFVCIRAEDLDYGSLGSALNSIGVNASIEEIGKYVFNHNEKCLVIDSAEKILDAKIKHTFTGLIDKLINKGWHIILCLREYSQQQLEYIIGDKEYARVYIDQLNVTEISSLTENNSDLSWIFNSIKLGPMSKNLFFVSVVARIVKCKNDAFDYGILKIKQLVWEQLIENCNYTEYGMNIKRGTIFEQIAIARATSRKYRVACAQYDAQALNHLISDGLLIREGDYVKIDHDIWEDWAMERHISKLHNESKSFLDFISQIDDNGAMYRAFRNWITDNISEGVLECDDIMGCLNNECTNQNIKDEVILSIILNGNTNMLLGACAGYAGSRSEHEALLLRVALIMKVACIEPDKKIPALLVDDVGRGRRVNAYKPYGECWDELIIWAERNREGLSSKELKCIIEMIDFRFKNGKYEKSERKSAAYAGDFITGLIGRSECKKIEYSNGLRILMSILPECSEQFMVQLKMIESNKKYLEVEKYIYSSMDGFPYAKHLTDTYIKNIKRLLAKGDEHNLLHRNREMLIDESNIYSYHETASAYRMPFYGLFRSNFWKALHFLLELCEEASQRLMSRRRAKTSVIEMCNGEKKEIEFSNSMWMAYRDIYFNDDIPCIIKSGLMALEDILIESEGALSDNEYREIFDNIAKNSKTAFTLSVLAAISVCKYEKLGISVYPLLKSIEFLRADNERVIREKHKFNFGVSRRLDYVYSEERKASGNRPFRSRGLADIMLEMQLHTEHKDSIQEIIDSHFKVDQYEDIFDKILLTKIDIRKYVISSQHDGNIVMEVKFDDDIEESRVRLIEENHKRLDLFNAAESLRQSAGENTYREENTEKIVGILQSITKSENSVILDLFREIAVIYFMAHRESMDKYSRDIIIEFIVSGVIESLKTDNAVNREGLMKCAEALYQITYYEPKYSRMMIEILLSDNWEIGYAVIRGLYTDDVMYIERIYNALIKYNRMISKYANKEVHARKRLINTYRNKIVEDYENKISEISNRNDTYMFNESLALIAALNNRRMGAYSIADFSKIMKALAEMEVVHGYTYGNMEIRFKVAYELAVGLCKPNALTEEIKELLKKMCEISPNVMQYILSSANAFAEESDSMKYYWMIWDTIENAIAKAIQIDEEKPYYDRKYGKLIRRYIYLDIPWQKVDVDKKCMAQAKERILRFAALNNTSADVLEGLASLMYYFPEDYSVEGAKILGAVNKQRTIDLLSQSNSQMYIIDAIYYIIYDTYSEKPIDRSVYDACIQILNMLIDLSVPQAYWLREELITKKYVK